MKRGYWIILLAIISCNTKHDKTLLPEITTNSSLNDVWDPIRDIVSQKEYSIVYSEGGGPFVEQETLTHKIFSFNGEMWQKIEIRNGIKVLDTVNNNVEIIEKDITLKRDCQIEESKAFLNSLIQLGLFELSDEKALIEKCEKSSSLVTPTQDAGRLTFYLIHGKDVRILSFHDIDQKIKDCPNVNEFNHIRKIRALFKEVWFFNKHY